MSEFPDATVGYLIDKIERYERLIRWLAKEMAVRVLKNHLSRYGLVPDPTGSRYL